MPDLMVIYSSLIDEVIDYIKVIYLDYMLHVRTLRDAFLADIFINLRNLLLLTIRTEFLSLDQHQI